MSEEEEQKPPAPPRADYRSPEQWEALKEKAALWCAMTDQERAAAGEPRTLVAFADYYSIGRRTIQKWNLRPDFKARVAEIEAARTAKVNVAQGTKVPARLSGDDQSNAEIFGEVVRAQLIAAAAGDKVALDFIKTANISKPFVDALTAEFQTEFPDQSDEELAGMFVDAFPELCVSQLELRGWVVLPPGAPTGTDMEQAHQSEDTPHPEGP
jgi:hypothetical protein